MKIYEKSIKSDKVINTFNSLSQALKSYADWYAINTMTSAGYQNADTSNVLTIADLNKQQNVTGVYYTLERETKNIVTLPAKTVARITKQVYKIYSDLYRNGTTYHQAFWYAFYTISELENISIADIINACYHACYYKYNYSEIINICGAECTNFIECLEFMEI